MKIIKVKDYQAMSDKASELIANAISANPKVVLGLATGGTPEGLYKALRNNDALSWKQVTTFNLDEYVGLPLGHKLSYKEYMKEQLFNHVDINPANAHIPSSEGDVDQNGKAYDQQIANAGGIDVQILGIGENAHIAFNEPGSSKDAGTRKVQLTESTINANSRYFDSKADVPHFAISMGIKSILKAKKIILLASGQNKADAIFKTINGDVSEANPSSFLQDHDDVTIIVDEAAAHLI